MNSAFPNLLLYIASLQLVYMPVTKVTVESSFSVVRQVKTRLRSHLGENTLDQAMHVYIEDPSTLSDDKLAVIVTHENCRRYNV